ncbi:vitelline membrane outer layer protein 1 [Folsomia candida]|uniref:Vitelline membrane outer layer protein 1 n=1 Tax=Folsomia candida TaxID=158441 RepID=A0A226EZS0_FOLCA|nr:vitelline membrane outer layer protein 1 [Folsomia candida]OXA62678.1 Vitelline membrane outer layer protein 1 [Folsomia candida]
MWSILTIALFSTILITEGNIIIESPPETNYGEWGPWSRCPFGTYAQALQVRTEPYQGLFGDDTATNGIRLYCGDPNNGSTIYITSTVAEWGNWGSVFSCRSDGRPLPPDGFVSGFQLRVEPPQGAGDDTSTNNARIFCTYPPHLGIPEEMKEGDGLTYGRWTSDRKCFSNQAICALQTQVERYQGDPGDDTAMNNIRAECCDR